MKLLNMIDDEERGCAYLHLYGVSQACAMLALKRNENVEQAIIAGMLHDIYSYANMDSNDHAHKVPIGDMRYIRSDVPLCLTEGD